MNRLSAPRAKSWKKDGAHSQVLEEDLDKLNASRASIDGLVSAQVEKLAEGRNILKRALEADLQKLADARADIDNLVASQVAGIAEGRNVLSRKPLS